MIKLRIRGFDEREEALSKLSSSQLREIAEGAFEILREPLVKAAKAEAPVDTGKLRDSISGKYMFLRGFGPQGFELDIECRGVPYAEHVVSGTHPHLMPLSALEDWASRHGVKAGALWISIFRRGTKPNPFFERAFQNIGVDAKHKASQKVADLASKFLTE